MPAVEQGAQAAQPQQAQGACGASTLKIRLASKCKSWQQTVFLFSVTAVWQCCLSLPLVVFALMTFIMYNGVICARWAGFALSIYY